MTSTIDLDREDMVAAMLPSGAFVVLDTALDDHLLAEGWARDLVRLVQDERKAVGLHVADRIDLLLSVPGAKEAWTRQYAEWIGTQVGADNVGVEGVDASEPRATVTKVGS